MSNLSNFKEAFNSIFGISKNTKNEPVNNNDNTDFQKQDSQELNHEPVNNNDYTDFQKQDSQELNPDKQRLSQVTQNSNGSQNSTSENMSFQQQTSEEVEKKWTTTAIQPNASLLNEHFNGYGNRETGQTIISDDTKIEGSIISNSNLEVSGTIIGDVVTTESINVSGKLKGDIKAYTVSIDGGHIVGDTKAVSVFRASDKAILSGDISCVDVEVLGKVKGDITSNRLKIHKDAVVLGDINSDEISIEFGAKVKGQINPTKDFPMDILKVEIE